MGILNKLLIGLVLLPQLGFASILKDPIDPQSPAAKLCSSTKEYMEAMNYLRTTNVIVFQEQTARLIAEKISKGCNGSAQRFKEILTLLKSVGLSDARSIEIALEFSTYDPETQKNFLEVFSKSFLSEFFDYEYPKAIHLAYELSKDYKGSAVRLREDFLHFVRFCKDTKNMDLPANLCAELSVKFARLSQYYPEGVRSAFDKLYSELRKPGVFGLDMKAAMDYTYNVLKHGPKASDNFLTGVQYAQSKKGLEMSQAQSLEFGLKMAERSYVGEEPPILSEDDSEEVARAIQM